MSDAELRKDLRLSVHYGGTCMFGAAASHGRCHNAPTTFCTGPMEAKYWPVWCDDHAPRCRGHEHPRIVAEPKDGD